MMCVEVSIRRSNRCVPWITSTENSTSIEVSSALPFSSPSPCSACASPRYNSAPGFATGKYTVAPSPISLKSMLPPHPPESPVGGGACVGRTAEKFRRTLPRKARNMRFFAILARKSGLERTHCSATKGVTVLAFFWRAHSRPVSRRASGECNAIRRWRPRLSFCESQDPDLRLGSDESRTNPENVCVKSLHPL
jgi:hypothetical protein